MILSLLRDCLQLIYPKTCFSCHTMLTNLERTICLNCYLNMPKQHENKYLIIEGIKYRIYSRYQFKRKGITHHLIHELKYNNGKRIGKFFGDEIIPLIKDFNSVSHIIPVPLHWKKKKIRGYNQSEIIAVTISKKTSLRLNTSTLIRKKNLQSQTKKRRYNRFEGVENVFDINYKTELENQHVILIDDVITTGATITACVSALNKIKNIKISIVCVAN